MKSVISTSPVNIALIKYWGKANRTLVLPTTTSISLTLTDLFTETKIETGPFSFELNQKIADEKETERVKAVLKHFRDDQVMIRSTNNFPTASGLASSASGFAALTVGLNAHFQSHYTLQELATLTRIGSGSSCRSLVDDFAIWEKNGSLRTLKNPFQDLRMIVVLISEAKKALSSRDAMQVTMDTARDYGAWVKASDQDFLEITAAIEKKDWMSMGLVMEKNSQRLHQIMNQANPPIVYQQAESLKVLQMVKEARSKGLVGFTTMDAGPNVKILIQGQDLPLWEKQLKAHIKARYLVSRIGGKAHAKTS